MTEIAFRLTKRVCACCGERKPVSEFYARPQRKAGWQSYCKPCQKAAVAKSKERHGVGPAAAAKHRSKWAAIAAEAAASA